MHVKDTENLLLKRLRFLSKPLSLDLLKYTLELVLPYTLLVIPVVGLQPNKNDNIIFIGLQKLNF